MRFSRRVKSGLVALMLSATSGAQQSESAPLQPLAQQAAPLPAVVKGRVPGWKGGKRVVYQTLISQDRSKASAPLAVLRTQLMADGSFTLTLPPKVDSRALRPFETLIGRCKSEGQFKTSTPGARIVDIDELLVMEAKAPVDGTFAQVNKFYVEGRLSVPPLAGQPDAMLAGVRLVYADRPLTLYGRQICKSDQDSILNINLNLSRGWNAVSFEFKWEAGPPTTVIRNASAANLNVWQFEE